MESARDVLPGWGEEDEASGAWPEDVGGGADDWMSLP
jgi:hypothetical protein